MSVLQKRSSSAGGPPAQAAPTPPANTAKTQSQQRSPTCPPHPPTSNPITQRQRQGLLGALLQCARPLLSRESRSCGRAAYSREIVHFVRPKSAQSFLLQLECGGCGLLAGPDRLRCRRASGLNGTEMGKSEAGLLLLAEDN